MKKDTHSTSDKYERFILEGLNRIDTTNADERSAVYGAAFRALRNTHMKNTSVDKSTPNSQIQALENAILEIETKLSRVPIDDLTDVTQLQSKKPTIFSKLKRLYQTIVGMKVNFLETSEASLPAKANRITTRNLWFLLASLFLVLTLITWNVIPKVEKPTDNFTLPMIISGEALAKLPKAIGTNVTEKTLEKNDGILFEITPTSDALNNRINFQLHRNWAERLTAMNKSFLVTIQLKKLNDVTLKFNLQTITGIHTAKTSLNIKDQNSNKIFVLSSDAAVKEHKDIFVIILEVDDAKPQSSEKILLLVENITISNI